MWVIPECMVFILESSSLLLESLQGTPEEREKSLHRQGTWHLPWVGNQSNELELNQNQLPTHPFLLSNLIWRKRTGLHSISKKLVCGDAGTAYGVLSLPLSCLRISQRSSYLQFLLSYSIPFWHCLDLIFFFLLLNTGSHRGFLEILHTGSLYIRSLQ